MHCCIDYAMIFHRGDSFLHPWLEEVGATAVSALVVGPLCFLVALAAVHDLSWRYPLQLVVSTVQAHRLLCMGVQPLFASGDQVGPVALS